MPVFVENVTDVKSNVRLVPISDVLF